MSEISTETGSKKKGLGRGLGSLLGITSPNEPEITKNSSEKPDLGSQSIQVSDELNTQVTIQSSLQSSPENKIWQVGIDKLSSGTYQPRKIFAKDPLEELAQSIRENGVLQPIVARRTDEGKLEIVAGERRWRAAQLAGLHEVPVILRSLENKEALELAIIENIQREDLNPIEEAEGFQRLIIEFSLSQSQVAEKVGKDRATVANAIRLLNLSQEVRDLVAGQKVSVGHAKILLSVPDEKKQNQLAHQIITDKLTVRKLEKLVSEIMDENSENQKSPADNQNEGSKLAQLLAEDLQKHLGTKVNIEYTKGKGRVAIYFYSDEELSSITDRIRES